MGFQWLIAAMDGRSIRSFFWWIYYSLFLGLCVFIFVAAGKYLKGLLLTGDLNLGKLTYGVAMGIMIFGLLSLVITYLLKSLWIKITGSKTET
jgi:hypothetical protein